MHLRRMEKENIERDAKNRAEGGMQYRSWSLADLHHWHLRLSYAIASSTLSPALKDGEADLASAVNRIVAKGLMTLTQLYPMEK